jgi:hypothetical protein
LKFNILKDQILVSIMRNPCPDDGPGEEVGMLPFRGDDPSSGQVKRRSGGSGGTVGMANGSGAGNAAGVSFKMLCKSYPAF